MAEKFKYIILLLFIPFFLYSNNKSKVITIIKQIDKKLSEEKRITINHLAHITESIVLENDQINVKTIPDSLINEITEEYNSFYFKKITNFIFSNGYSGFYYFKVINDNNQLKLSIDFFNSLGSSIFQEVLPIDDTFHYDNNGLISNWTDIINKSIEVILNIKERKIVNKELMKKSFQYVHDYPILNIAVSGISSKIYFDSRMVSQTQKIFSPSPIDIRLTFFPLRYFETGLFCKIDINNMVYHYYHINSYQYKLFQSYFVLHYGLFAGMSYFNEMTHYSIGFQFYNFYYDPSLTETWEKVFTADNYFLPQFAIYQRLDFKIFKILYFTIMFNIRTIPKFYLSDNNFYSKPFHYDFIITELSFIGISIMF